jgi:protein CpxP
MLRSYVSGLTAPSWAAVKTTGWSALTVCAALAGAAALHTAEAQTRPAAGSTEVATEGAPSHHGKKAGGIDALIQHLHDSFKITPQQEPQWQNVATVMRENAETLSNLAKERSERAKTATALDDLKSYAKISEAHAAATKRLIPAFQALYDSMSPEQKQAADAEFRDHFREHHHQAA